MLNNFLDPVIVFFTVGLLARLLNVSLSIPTVVYDTISIYLLLSIGLKGGHELAQINNLSFFSPCIAAVFVGILVPMIAFLIAKQAGKFSREDAVALAAHYGAASVVTFAVALNFLEDNRLSYEGFLTILLVLIEVTGILTAFSFLHIDSNNIVKSLKKIFHDVILNKSIFLILAGIFIGWISSSQGFKHVQILFLDLFKGILCFFMLEMGLVCAEQIAKINSHKRFIITFGIAMPLIAGITGIFLGKFSGLSYPGTVVLATIAASASYIAAPVATRSILPQVNLSVPMTCSLGITFPFNIFFGIPIYSYLAKFIY